MIRNFDQGGVPDDSLDCTLGGSRALRDRLILMCKVFSFIDLIYFALFTFALSLDSDASYFEIATQSFSPADGFASVRRPLDRRSVLAAAVRTARTAE